MVEEVREVEITSDGNVTGMVVRDVSSGLVIDNATRFLVDMPVDIGGTCLLVTVFVAKSWISYGHLKRGRTFDGDKLIPIFKYKGPALITSEETET